jgi:hypothetical protein
MGVGFMGGQTADTVPRSATTSITQRAYPDPAHADVSPPLADVSPPLVAHKRARLVRARNMLLLPAQLDIQIRMEGGLGSSLLRCCCAGASMFFSHYTLLPGSGPRGDVLLAPPCPG